jgi:hypothetical protein
MYPSKFSDSNGVYFQSVIDRPGNVVIHLLLNCAPSLALKEVTCHNGMYYAPKYMRIGSQRLLIAAM